MVRTLIQRAVVLCLAALAALAAAATIALPAHAADNPPSSTAAKVDQLTPARALIAERRWREAITTLQQLNDTGSADWQNLMGYAQRKASPPDLAAAERHYDEALRLDPKHRGALEYSGELYLMRGDLPRAEGRLATLDKACFFGCEEYSDLKAAVARFKANGNRYVASP